MIPKDPPPGWGDDEITKFVDMARTNAYATFANLPVEYGKLAQIDRALRTDVSKPICPYLEDGDIV